MSEEVFRNKKVQKAYEELKEAIEKAGYNIMEIFEWGFEMRRCNHSNLMGVLSDLGRHKNDDPILYLWYERILIAIENDKSEGLKWENYLEKSKCFNLG